MSISSSSAYDVVRHSVYGRRLIVCLSTAIVTSFSSLSGILPAFAGDGSKVFEPVIRIATKFEYVDQENYANTALASVLDLHLGFKSKNKTGFNYLVEFEALRDLGVGEFNSTINGVTDRPKVKDPDASELNRAWLGYSNESFNLKVGRQKIDLGNGRFVGSARFRLNQQTYDAVRADWNFGKKLEVTGIYVNKVHRVLGPDHPKGQYSGDTNLFHITYRPISSKYLKGQLEAYSYNLDFEESPYGSLSIRGAHVSFVKKLKGAKLKGSFEVTNQEDRGNNPYDLDLNMAAIGLKYVAKPFGAFGGLEVLEGNGSVGFQKPLARKHKSLGLADVFSSTPVTGLEDLYGGVTYVPEWKVGKSAPTFDFAYHKFKSELTGQSFGSEWDLRMKTKFSDDVSVEAAVVSFSGDGGYYDVLKSWLYVQYHY